MAYQTRLMGPVRGLMGIYTNLATARASLLRVQNLLDTPPDVVEAGAPERLAACRGHVAFEDVHLDFGRGREGLHGIDLDIPAGQTVAIVGASGSGKSTIADLVGRQVDPDRGRVTLDGHDLRELSLEDVRRHVAIVEQDPFIFHTSVADNVRYARPDATDAQVLDALSAAGLDELVASMPDGPDTTVGERGRQLSAGERQRIAIARAFLAGPVVLVLDEATGSLDPSSEAVVLQGYERVLRDRTTIIITHRLDLARQAERIVVLENGRIEEDGTADVLEKQGRAFRDVFIDVLKG
jgi:ATP-binding cassette subfamily B protein